MKIPIKTTPFLKNKWKLKLKSLITTIKATTFLMTLLTPIKAKKLFYLNKSLVTSIKTTLVLYLNKILIIPWTLKLKVPKTKTKWRLKNKRILKI